MAVPRDDLKAHWKHACKLTLILEKACLEVIEHYFDHVYKNIMVVLDPAFCSITDVCSSNPESFGESRFTFSRLDMPKYI